MTVPDWQELFSGRLNRYLEESQSLILILLNKNLEIVQCNENVLRLLHLSHKPLGARLADFLIPETPELATLPQEGETLPLRLSFRTPNAGVHLLTCQIIHTGAAYLVIGERLLILESPLVEKISALTQELANLSRELREKNKALVRAQQQLKVLRGLLPICSVCKDIRDDQGYWRQLEAYIRDHSEAEFTHSLCPKCMKEIYGDILELADEKDS